MELATVDFSDRLPDIEALMEKYDHPMMPIFEAVKAQKKVVSLSKTLEAAGTFRQGGRFTGIDYPRLAVTNWPDGQAWLNFGGQYVLIGERITHPGLRSNLKRPAISYCTCPPIPKDIKALQRTGDIWCFETDKWDPAPIQQLGDPVLLRPLHGDHYTVIAEWDLTPLERELFGSLE